MEAHPRSIWLGLLLPSVAFGIIRRFMLFAGNGALVSPSGRGPGLDRGLDALILRNSECWSSTQGVLQTTQEG